MMMISMQERRDEDPNKPLLLDQDNAFLNSMASTVKPVIWQEVKSANSKDTIIAVLMNLRSSFPFTKEEITVELQPY